MVTSCLHGVLVILAIFHIFHYYYICYNDLWSLMLQLELFGGTKNCTHIRWEINVCVLTASPTSSAPISLFSLFPCSLRHSDIKIRPVNNPIVASKCSCERKHLMSLTLNQKWEMIKLCEEGPSKAETGQKLGLLHETAVLWIQRKSSWRKLKVLLQWTHEWWESETAFLLIWRQFSCAGYKIKPTTTFP